MLPTKPARLQVQREILCFSGFEVCVFVVRLANL